MKAKYFDYRHWTDGGTMVTNFRLDELPTYEKAVAKYNLESKDKLFTSSVAYANGMRLKFHGSLHSFTQGDLSDFWKIFRDIKNLNTPVFLQ